MMPSRTVVAAALVALPCLISSRLLAADFTVKLEVTQGIQYFGHSSEQDNSIELVENRRTAVRAKVDGLPVKTVANVTVESFEIVGTTEVPAPDNISEFRDFLNKGVPWDRGDTNSTLNFRIESLTATTSQEFKVKLKIEFSDGSSLEAEGSTKLKVVTVRSLEIKLVPMKFTSKSGSVFGPPNKEEVETSLIELVEGCFPIKAPGTVFSWQTAMDVSESKNKGCASMVDDNTTGGKSDVDKALEDLNTNYGASKDVLVYGLMTDKPGGATIGDGACMPTLGWAQCDKRSAFGTAELELAPKAFAHELGHLLTLKHCDACEGATESCGMEGQVPFDVQTMTAQPYRTQSFMTCGPVPGTDVWATPKNYKVMLDALKGNGGDIKTCNEGKLKEPRVKNLKRKGKH
jgi:hypothetical protein